MARKNSRYDPDHDDRFAPYVSVSERRRKAALAMEKLRKKGVTVSPVQIEGRVIASTFWGKAWCDNLERYRDYENRLERGRTYVRNGSVVDLQLAPREVTATVSGSSLYKVKITIGEVPAAQWKSICKDCAGGIDSIVELLQGRFAKGVMERICRQGEGLFPKPAEIRFSCSCPDHASMCKHVAAVLYGVGARLDEKPELLFRLRAVSENDLVAGISSVLPMSRQEPAAGRLLQTDDVAALFGLDMGDVGEPTAPPVAAAPPRPGRRTAAARKPAAGVAKDAARRDTKPAVQPKAVAVKPVGRKASARRSRSVPDRPDGTGATLSVRPTGGPPPRDAR
jgi:uncharacterized Zn finger protein